MDQLKTVWNPETVFSWSIVSVVEQRMQKWKKHMTFERAERAPWVRIIPINDAWELLLTKERRSELNNGEWWYDIRLAGGKVFDSLTEYVDFKESWWDIAEAAMKAVTIEAREELWFMVSSMTHLHTSACWATMRWDLYYFVVDAFHQLNEWQDLSELEDIEPFWASQEEVTKFCMDWSISEDRSAAVLLRYLQ